MKINITLFTLLISSFTLYGQITDTIRLTKDTGLSSSNTRGTFIRPNGSFLLDSANYELCGIWKFELDKLQNRFNKLLQNKDRDSSYKSFKKSELVKEGLNTVLHVFSGITKTGEYILIPDINADKNFLNDPVYKYPVKKISQENLQSELRKLPIIKFGVETWNVDHLQKRQMTLRLVPKAYFGNFIMKDKDTLANNLMNFLECVDYVKGDVTLTGKEYNLYIKNEFLDARFTDPDNITISLRSKNNVEVENNEVTYYAADTIPAEGNLYQIGEIDPYGEWVTLNHIGKESDGISVGKYAKNIISLDVSNTNKINLRKLEGNYVLFDFWGTWCAPCLEGIPKLKELFDKYSHKNFKLIGIAQDKNTDIVKTYIAKQQMKWPNIFQFLNGEQPIISSYKVTNFPTYIIIAPNGRIIYRGTGIQSLNEVERILNKIFL